MKTDRAVLVAAVQIILGIIIFTSAWWVASSQYQSALYIFGFVTVLIGIATATLLTGKR